MRERLDIQYRAELSDIIGDELKSQTSHKAELY